MPIVRGKLLLGWMWEQEALQCLLNQCVFDPPKTEAELREIWNSYKARVDGLPTRTPVAPKPQKLTTAEKLFANKVLKLRNKPDNRHIKNVVKIRPNELTVHQLMVVLDVEEKYEQQMANAQGRTKLCLGFGFPKPAWTTSYIANVLYIRLPHGEFNLAYNPAARQFLVQENARWISVYRYGERMLLWAGYHRSYAVLSSHTYPEDTERVLLAVETTEGDRLLCLPSERPERRDVLLSERPPLMSDFFDDLLCMTVNLRKGHWEFQVDLATLQAKRVWVHD